MSKLASQITADEAEAFVRSSTIVEEAAEGDILGSLGLNPTLFVAQLVNFLIVLLVLWRFAYKPLLRVMNERTARIEEGLRKADEAHARVEALAREREEVLREARREAKRVSDETRAAAQAASTQQLARAKEDVERTITAGEARLQQQKQQMLAELKGELAALVVSAARKVAHDTIDVKAATEKAAEAIEAMRV